jgi:hypothetical protein
MRKHNKRFARRWGRDIDDRSNFPQQMAHGFVKNKAAQFAANGLLQAVLARAGI